MTNNAQGITYTPEAIEIDGVREAVRYTIRKSGAVVVHLMDAGCEMELTPADADYAAARDAASARHLADGAEAARKLRAAIADGSKWWVGQTIKGRGWKIVADASYDRIRVIFARRPTDAQKDAVKSAGFCWSPTLKSWNRGLRCKAWRAAELLAVTLKDLDDPNAAARMRGNKMLRELERAEGATA